MATEEPRTSSVVRVPGEPVIEAELAVVVVPGARVGLAVSEDLVVPAVRAALVVPENLVVPAALAVRVAPESPVALELAPAEAAQEHDRVEVPLRTRSVIAAHPRGQVPVPKVEDSVAVVETTREQAATEAAAAWAAVE